MADSFRITGPDVPDPSYVLPVGETFTAPSGDPYEIMHGWPAANSVPATPHVIDAAAFRIAWLDDNSTLLSAPRTRVLALHANQYGDVWAPQSPQLAEIGITIPSIVDDWEEKHPDLPIDVIFACRNYTSRRLPKISRLSEPVLRLRPRVHVVAGQIARGIVVRDLSAVELRVKDPDHVVYKDWAATNTA